MYFAYGKNLPADGYGLAPGTIGRFADSVAHSTNSSHAWIEWPADHAILSCCILIRCQEYRVMNDSKIAMPVLQGEFRDGDTVVVDVEPDGRFTFHKAEAAKSVEA